MAQAIIISSNIRVMCLAETVKRISGELDLRSLSGKPKARTKRGIPSKLYRVAALKLAWPVARKLRESPQKGQGNPVIRLKRQSFNNPCLSGRKTARATTPAANQPSFLPRAHENNVDSSRPRHRTRSSCQPAAPDDGTSDTVRARRA